MKAVCMSADYMNEWTFASSPDGLFCCPLPALDSFHEATQTMLFLLTKIRTNSLCLFIEHSQLFALFSPHAFVSISTLTLLKVSEILDKPELQSLGDKILFGFVIGSHT